MSKREIEREVSLRCSEYERGRLYYIGETEAGKKRKELRKICQENRRDWIPNRILLPETLVLG